MIVTDTQRVPEPIKWRMSCVIKGDWRLVNRDELYDLATDPNQRTDLAAEHPDLVVELRDAYEAWWSLCSRQVGEDIPISIGAEAQAREFLQPGGPDVGGVLCLCAPVGGPRSLREPSWRDSCLKTEALQGRSRPSPRLDDPMLASRYSQGKLYALAVAIEAAAARDPYPRLAEFMRTLEIQEAEPWPIRRLPMRRQLLRPEAGAY